MKKLCVALAVMAVLAISAGTVSAAEFVFKAAHNGGAGHPFQDGYEKFKEVIAAATNGRVDVQIFPGEQLGSEEQVNEMIQFGTVEINATGSAAVSNWVPEAELFNLPFIFRDADHMYRVLDGPIGDRIADDIEQKLDAVFLGWWYSGNRNAWNNKRPVMTPADFAGLKIRVMGSAVLVDAFNALGAQATPMSFGEVYTSIQQGVIDGAETDHIDLEVEKFYEVTKHVSLTGHMYLPIAFVFSRKIYDTLPKDIQTAIFAAAREATVHQRKMVDVKTEKALSFLKSKGIKFYDVDKGPFQEAVKSVYKKNAERVGGLAAIEQVANQ
ncbi:MAG: TRAP transporter substrate-binding protein [Rhodospirillales bacterium]|nr:TRAP transporter substrate-binding protein [Rhodospirillales bacterium]